MSKTMHYNAFQWTKTTQITCLLPVCSAVSSDGPIRNIKALHYWSFVRRIHGHRWIPLTKDQFRKKKNVSISWHNRDWDFNCRIHNVSRERNFKLFIFQYVAPPRDQWFYNGACGEMLVWEERRVIGVSRIAMGWRGRGGGGGLVGVIRKEQVRF